MQTANVVKFYGTCVSRVDDNVYPVLVMEYCNDTLDKVIERPDYLAPGNYQDTPQYSEALHQAAKFAFQISCGLMAIQGLGFAHRDMKPENILVSQFSVNSIL